MKNLTFLLPMILLATSLLQGCSSQSPNAGEEVVFIRQPYFFGSGGVVMDECPGTGLYWTALSTSGEIVNIKPYQKTESFNDLITKDNNPVDFTVYVAIKNKSKEGDNCFSPVLVSKFGMNWYNTKVRQPLGEFVRGYTKKKLMFEMTTDDTVTAELSRSLHEYLVNFVKREGIPVQIVKITVGRVVPPDDVLEETIATAKQKQRAKTEVERTLAENSRFNAETSKAKADAAYMNKMKMDPSTYVKLKYAENQKMLYDMLPNLKGVNVYLGTAPQAIVNK